MKLSLNICEIALHHILTPLTSRSHLGVKGQFCVQQKCVHTFLVFYLSLIRPFPRIIVKH